jgi:hypothetical protein
VWKSQSRKSSDKQVQDNALRMAGAFALGALKELELGLGAAIIIYELRPDFVNLTPILSPMNHGKKRDTSIS